MNSASRWPVVQLSHRRSPPRTRIPCSSVRADLQRLSVSSERSDTLYLTNVRETRGRNIEDTAHLGCPFPLIHLIRRRIYKACYVNAIVFQNNNTIHEYSCTLSTYPHSIEIILCRVAPRNSMKRQYFFS